MDRDSYLLILDRRLQGVLPEEVTILGRYEKDMNWTKELSDPVSFYTDCSNENFCDQFEKLLICVSMTDD